MRVPMVSPLVRASSCFISPSSRSGSPTKSSSAGIQTSSMSKLGPERAAAMHALNRRCIALLLAEHLGVVDFLDLDARSARCRPEVGDAAVSPDVLRRPREQREERPPRGGVGAAVEGQGSDRITSQQLRELDDGRGPAWPVRGSPTCSVPGRTPSVKGPSVVMADPCSVSRPMVTPMAG